VIFSIIIFTSIFLCYRICGFFFVYKISPEKKIAQREEELHRLVMTDSFLYNHLYQIWTIWQLEFLLLCFHILTLFTVKYSCTGLSYIFSLISDFCLFALFLSWEYVVAGSVERNRRKEKERRRAALVLGLATKAYRYHIGR
jgi:hypothetical protein